MKSNLLKTLFLSAALCASFAASAGQTLAEKHGGMWPKSTDGFVTKNQCLKCHVSYEELAKKTASLSPNPHRSHMGAVNCEECHKADAEKPVLMCNQCHKFSMPAK